MREGLDRGTARSQLRTAADDSRYSRQEGRRRDKSVPGTHLLRGGRAVAGLRRAAGMVATCQERPMVHTATHTTR